MTTILTDRLILKRMTIDDFDWFSAMRADPEVMRYIGTNGPLTSEQSREKLERYLSCWTTRGLGMFSVRTRENPDPIGWGGLQPMDGTDEIEVGYAFAQRAWGRGYATETAMAAVRWGFEILGLERIVAVAYAENEGSRRVMNKLGMRFERMRYVYETDSVYYSVTPETFARAASSRAR